MAYPPRCDRRASIVNQSRLPCPGRLDPPQSPPDQRHQPVGVDAVAAGGDLEANDRVLPIRRLGLRDPHDDLARLGEGDRVRDEVDQQLPDSAGVAADDGGDRPLDRRAQVEPFVRAASASRPTTSSTIERGLNSTSSTSARAFGRSSRSFMTVSSAPPLTCLESIGRDLHSPRLRGQLLGLDEEVREDRDLGPQLVGRDRREDEVDRALGVEVGLGELVLSARGDEDDRRHLRLPALADGRGRLEAVHDRHDARRAG